MGKSTVLQIFNKLGAHTFNVDVFVHDILRQQIVINKLCSILGNSIIKNDSKGMYINKKRIAEIIFYNTDKRKAVEKIIHPAVLKSIKQTKSEILSTEPSAIIVFEVPLLFEAGYEIHFDKTAVVYSKLNTAIERAAKKVSLEMALKILHAQMPITRKKAMADYIINNNGDIKDTKKQVASIFRKLNSKQTD